MRCPKVRVVYTDGRADVGSALDWTRFRADGVDVVFVNDREFSGHALYWLYREEQEGGMWVVGMASTYASPPPPEVLFRDDGSVVTRNIVTMPDLHHDDVKLGWWKRPAEGESYVPGGRRAA